VLVLGSGGHQPHAGWPQYEAEVKSIVAPGSRPSTSAGPLRAGGLGWTRSALAGRGSGSGRGGAPAPPRHRPLVAACRASGLCRPPLASRSASPSAGMAAAANVRMARRIVLRGPALIRAAGGSARIARRRGQGGRSAAGRRRFATTVLRAPGVSLARPPRGGPTRGGDAGRVSWRALVGLGRPVVVCDSHSAGCRCRDHRVPTLSPSAGFTRADMPEPGATLLGDPRPRPGRADPGAASRSAALYARLMLTPEAVLEQCRFSGKGRTAAAPGRSLGPYSWPPRGQPGCATSVTAALTSSLLPEAAVTSSGGRATRIGAQGRCHPGWTRRTGPGHGLPRRPVRGDDALSNQRRPRAGGRGARQQPGRRPR
jgi:hypothetical protein